MSKNTALGKARNAKQDEFYTQYEDIQKELNHYEKHFEGKTVFCNCDDPFESNFCRFFLRNFNYLKLKRLICTSYSSSPVLGAQLLLFDEMEEPVKKGIGYVMDITEPIAMENGMGVSDFDINRLLKSEKRGVKKLKGDGDFRSEECIKYLKEADIVVTNPPFSLFREYMAQLMEYEKKFLIIGNQNAITYKEIFPLLMENKIWLGFKSGGMAFELPEKYLQTNKSAYKLENGKICQKLGNICWFTNLDHNKRHEKLELYCHYYGNEEHYPKYDNYDAINVDKVAEIPLDYFEGEGYNLLENREQRTENREQRTENREQRTELAMALSECQLHSSTNTIQNNSQSSETNILLESQRADAMLQERECIQGYSFVSTRCNGRMGVPITFLDKYNPAQFEIIGLDRYIKDNPHYGYRFTIRGKETYARIIIKRKL